MKGGIMGAQMAFNEYDGDYLRQKTTVISGALAINESMCAFIR